MKYVLLLPDGAADNPCPDLDGKTPLEAAATPALDALAREGFVGRVHNAPPSKPAGSDVCTMALLGYDPVRYHTGRAPLEAPSLGIELKPGQTAFRANFIHVDDGKIIDHCAGHITTEEAAELLEAVRAELETDTLHFHPGAQYRNLMIADHTDWVEAGTVPPHDVPNHPLAAHLPTGPGADALRGIIDQSAAILARHPVNEARRDRGERAATHLWPWGQGIRPALPTFEERFGVRGAMIAAVDLLRSLAILLGLDLLAVDGMTGYLDTNYANKGAAAVEALDRYDLVVCHVEAPDEAGHQRDAAAKREAIEQFDRHVAGPALAAARRRGDVRIACLPDHPTPCDAGVHTRDPVPFVIWGPGADADGATAFTEAAGRESALCLSSGPELMPLFLGSDRRPG